MSNKLKIKNWKSKIKEMLRFLTHHNAMIIALELAAFVGVILTFAAEGDGNNELGSMNYESLGAGIITQEVSLISPDSSLVTSIPEDSNMTTTIEQLVDNSEEQIAESMQPVRPDVNQQSAFSNVSAKQLAQKYAQADEVNAKYQIDGASLKRIAKDDPNDKIEVALGNESNSEFSPELKISRSRFGKEAIMMVKPKALEGVAIEDKNLNFEGKKINFETPNIDYSFYEIAVSADYPDGGYEYEAILKSKPATNKIEFAIQTKNVDFHLQPDGSYAGFHIERSAEKIVWGGVLFNIQKIKISDKVGDSIFGKLDIKTNSDGTGEMIITVPQEFLDKAIYPVIVDPTDTYTTAGTFAWTCPADVSTVSVEVWGGGGGGAGGNGGLEPGAGGGGGGGAYSKKNSYSVTPGSNYTVVVGSAGSGGAMYYAGGVGGDSYFVNNSTVMAKGGGGGYCPCWPSYALGGAAGSGVGDVKYSGGNSCTMGGTIGSAGGGSGGTGSNGNSATSDSPPAAVAGGGPGGRGGGRRGYNSTGYSPVSGPGGGGGGGNYTNAGAAGWAGQVAITYTVTVAASYQPRPPIISPSGGGFMVF